MVKKIGYLVLLAAVAALLYFAYGFFFPSDAKQIGRQLNKLAEATSFAPDQAALSRLASVDKLVGFFTADVEVYIEIPGYGSRTFIGKDEIRETALAARAALRGLDVEFLDVYIKVGDDRETALAELTAKITPSGERDFYVQELKFLFKKVDGEWLINRVETVRTLGS